jgi:hypothetical protein
LNHAHPLPDGQKTRKYSRRCQVAEVAHCLDAVGNGPGATAQDD